MTEQTQPTDAALLPLIEKHLGLKPRRDDTVIDPRTGRFHDAQRYRDFAADILAKLGTPAGAGEPEHPHAELQKAWAPGHKWEWTKPGEGRWWHHNGEPEWDPDWQYRLAAATPQPTQAQAGAVPLTDEQLYEERQTAIPQLFDLAQQWADNKIHSYQFANEAEKIVDAVARRVESAHGIKGADHG